MMLSTLCDDIFELIWKSQFEISDLESLNHQSRLFSSFSSSQSSRGAYFFTLRYINVTKRRKKKKTTHMGYLTETKTPAMKGVRSHVSRCMKECRTDIKERKGRRKRKERRGQKYIRVTTRCDFTRDQESTKDEEKFESLWIRTCDRDETYEDYGRKCMKWHAR